MAKLALPVVGGVGDAGSGDTLVFGTVAIVVKCISDTNNIAP